MDTQLTSTVIGLGTAGYLSSVSFDYLSVNTLSAGQIIAATIGQIGLSFFYGDGTYIQNITGANITGTLPYTVYGSETIPLDSINPVGNLTIQGNLSAINASFQSLTTSTIIFGTGSGYLTLSLIHI